MDVPNIEHEPVVDDMLQWAQGPALAALTSVREEIVATYGGQDLPEWFLNAMTTLRFCEVAMLMSAMGGAPDAIPREAWRMAHRNLNVLENLGVCTARIKRVRPLLDSMMGLNV